MINKRWPLFEASKFSKKTSLFLITSIKCFQLYKYRPYLPSNSACPHLLQSMETVEKKSTKPFLKISLEDYCFCHL